MKLREIIGVSRELRKLEIPKEDCRILIKDCYSHIGKFLQSPKALKKEISNAQGKNLKGDEAYTFIVHRVIDYGDSFLSTF